MWQIYEAAILTFLTLILSFIALDFDNDGDGSWWFICEETNDEEEETKEEKWYLPKCFEASW